MSRAKSVFKVLVAMVLLAAALGGSLSAQFQGGDLYGTIIDESGAPLAKVKVTLTCDGQRYVGLTDGRGRVKFDALAPGNYSLKAEYADFDPVVYDTIEILVGRPTTVHMRMAEDAERSRTVTS